jgi:hypothetical protein
MGIMGEQPMQPYPKNQRHALPVTSNRHPPAEPKALQLRPAQTGRIAIQYPQSRSTSTSAFTSTSAKIVIADVLVPADVAIDGFLRSRGQGPEAHSRTCPTFAAKRAEPADLPADSRCLQKNRPGFGGWNAIGSHPIFEDAEARFSCPLLFLFSGLLIGAGSLGSSFLEAE